MKKYSSIVCSVIFLLCGMAGVKAQNRQIQFETGSFQDALEKAQREGKSLFMDCYTSWCGPCKLLAKNVFTVDSVADFFNAHFVNFSIDMEKGEGKELQKKYKVEAYPTLLLISSQGEEIFRSVGGCSAGELVNRFRQAMNPQHTIPGMAKKFAEGERNPQFVGQYWTALQKARLFPALSESTQVYFQGMPVEKICNEENWPLYARFVDIDNPLHHLMVEHIREFKEWKGAETIEEKLGNAYDAAIMGRLPNVGHTAKQLQQYTEDIRKINFSDTVRLFYLQTYLEIAKMKVEKQYDEFLEYLEKNLDHFSEEQRIRALVSLIMLADGTTGQRQKGNELLMREAKRIMQQNNGILPAYEQQLFGFIQFKLSGQKID